MRAAGGVEQEALRAGRELGAAPRDDVGSGRGRRPRGASAGRCRTFQTGRPTDATAPTGSSPLSWTASGSTPATIAASSVAEASAVIATSRGRPAGGVAVRTTRASSAASATDSSRGVPGTRLRPIASAPSAAAAMALPASPTPQIFTNGPARDVRRIVGHGARRRRTSARRGRRVAGANEGLADERGVEALRAPAGDGRRVADPRFGDDEPVVGHEVPQPAGTVRVDHEGPQVAVVDADQARVGLEREPQLALVVRLDERLEAERERARRRARAGRACADGGRRGAGRRRRRPRADRSSCRASTTNSLARTGIETGRPDRARGRRPTRRTSAARTAPRSPTAPPAW